MVKQNSLGYFHFTLVNLHPTYQSNFRNIQLLAICSHDYMTMNAKMVQMFFFITDKNVFKVAD